MPRWQQRHAELQDPAELRALVDALASALAFAHGEGGGWLHRDIKPSNILLLDGRWVLADWGIVRLPRGQTTARRTGTELGTPGFSAPEMFTDPHGAGFSSDIYSLGQVIGWVLTGRAPEINRPLLPPPGPWYGVVHKATRFEPGERPQSIEDFLALVERETAPQTELPSARSQVLVVSANQDESSDAAAALIELAASRPDDYALYLQDLTRLKPNMSGAALLERPRQAIDVVRAMTGHVDGDNDGRGPHYNDAKRAIDWLLNAARHAARERERELLAEAANGMCQWDGQFNEFDQQRAIRTWLGRLRGEAADVVAVALREHPDSAIHFTELLKQRGTAPAILSAVYAATDQQ
ncbi:serine/threonine-protein kinase [Streptomyces sp. NPDC058583]|uniref:serine/threonine-protein kinase n=1 Tax=unclassified Streptomyces TaxID=2593676 RepID=UPI0036606442